MDAFVRHTGTALPLPRDDVDTDQILPKQFLSRIERTGYGDLVFHAWRQEPGFVFEDRRFSGATILVTGRNFGCGSSREHAVWGLQQFGIRAVVAPSFGDIFLGNSVQSGLLPVTLGADQCGELTEAIFAEPGLHITIDLQKQTISWQDTTRGFEIEPVHRESLLLGLDDVGLILELGDEIEAYERRRPGWVPLLH